MDAHLAFCVARVSAGEPEDCYSELNGIGFLF